MKNIFKKNEIGRMFMRGDERFVLIIGKKVALIFDEMGGHGPDPEPTMTHNTREYIAWDFEIFATGEGSPRLYEIYSREDFPGMIGSIFMFNEHGPEAIHLVISDTVTLMSTPEGTFDPLVLDKPLMDEDFDELDFTKIS